MKTKHTKGKAEAEAWIPGSNLDPRWVVHIDGKICFVTSCNDEANAKEMARRWNEFENK